MSPLSKKPAFVVVDYESTGLNPAADVPLELALVVVNDNLDIIAEFESVIQPAAMPIWHELQEVVLTMHTRNGLIKDIVAGKGSVKAQVAEEAVLFLDHHGATGLPMCGNNVANFDRPFMRVHMPELEDEFHYRNIDISTIKELCRRYNPKVFAASPKEQEGVVQAHRALADAHASIEELDFYIEEFLMVDLV